MALADPLPCLPACKPQLWCWLARRSARQHQHGPDRKKNYSEQLQHVVFKAFGDRDFPHVLGLPETWFTTGSAGVLALVRMEPLQRYDGPLTATSPAEREQISCWKGYAQDEMFIADLRSFRHEC